MEDEKKHGDEISRDETNSEDVQMDSVFDTEDADKSDSEKHQENLQSLSGNGEQEWPHITDENPSSDDQNNSSQIDGEYLKKIDKKLESIVVNEQQLFSEMREMHKLYHNEFAGRLKAMQDELEQYHKIDKGRAYDDILAAIARIFVNYEDLPDEVEAPKTKKSVRYMLQDLEELLSIYGMTRLRSEPGDKRNPRHCQVLNRISTEDPVKHDTVVKSYNSGFYIGNRTIIKEVVDICLYDTQSADEDAAKEHIIETGETPVME